MATDFERALNEKANQDMRERTELHWREQIAKEIMEEAKRCEAIEEGRYSEEYESSRLATFNGGHIGGLTTAAAIVRRNPNV